MTNFPKPVLDYWHEAFGGDSSSTWAVSEKLNPKRPAMMLEGIDGSVRTILRPELIDRIGPHAAGATTIWAGRSRTGWCTTCGARSRPDARR